MFPVIPISLLAIFVKERRVTFDSEYITFGREKAHLSDIEELRFQTIEVSPRLRKMKGLLVIVMKDGVIKFGAEFTFAALCVDDSMFRAVVPVPAEIPIRYN